MEVVKEEENIQKNTNIRKENLQRDKLEPKIPVYLYRNNSKKSEKLKRLYYIYFTLFLYKYVVIKNKNPPQVKSINPT